MNHPYLYPDEAPWTDDYQELRLIRKLRNSTMDYLGQFPVKIQHHFAVTPEEQNALVNALEFFYEYFSDDDVCVPDWRDVAKDSRLELFHQLATKIATA
jgi:hypothetical protein